ncbi:MAG: flagellar protein FlaG [Burkholderiaceae bacterium]
MPVTALPAASAALVGGERRAPVVAVPPAPSLPGEVTSPSPLADATPPGGALATQANESLKQKGVDLAIEFDDELGRAIFRLVDSVTGELVRQVPSEDMLAVARALAAGESAGALVKTRA